MFKFIMINKGLEAETTLNETPKFKNTEDKPLNNGISKTGKVDINILKARAQEVQNRENKKNILIFVFSLMVLVFLAIYLSS